MRAAHHAAPHWRFPLLLALALVLLAALAPTAYRGDAVEYTVDTVAIASHASPDVRLEDIARTRPLLEGAFKEPFDQLERGMRAGERDLYAAFARGRGDKVYPVHFFGYPLMAALPFKLLDTLGLPPFRAFVVVNLAAVFVLGLALRRFFGDERRAWGGLALFMLCGGVLYFRWSSPECVSAALLLAGLLRYTSGAPVSGALLAGVSSLQNPTIVFFFGFAPLIKLAMDYRPGQTLAAALRAQLGRRSLLGLALGVAVFALPVLFNLYQYGVPNLIARRFSDPNLVGSERLLSFFFDLNQGMLIGLPGLLAALLLAGRALGAHGLRVLAACALFTLALALPALSILNWNSDAAGMMRYVFWASMPLVFALLELLRRHPGVKRLAVGVAVVQLLATAHAASYPYVNFSPLARQLLAHVPGIYHPEPEIFAERAGVHDNYLRADQVYAWRAGGQVVKALVHEGNPAAQESLCGGGATLAPGLASTPATRGWRYVDGPIRCQAGALAQRRFGPEDVGAGKLELLAGWSDPEFNGPGWDGIWSTGARSRLRLQVGGLAPGAIVIRGRYLDAPGRTRVFANGADLGWHALDRATALPLPQGPVAPGQPLVIEFEHERTRSPSPGDPRQLAFFLQDISVRAAAPSTP
ncbi:hypothetical protein B0920_17500 [Massilia sp. KIM]|uniref:hypothetical protein n=1 Tax=Massilia sp. KIM TaxID=1955422 RepID=UPI00098EE3B2|nr:hypothetical protein [Massilia sp. KIM]OON60750.1 hypothetical protein B0920_17500 [Massilia sp. KIM]